MLTKEPWVCKTVGKEPWSRDSLLLPVNVSGEGLGLPVGKKECYMIPRLVQVRRTFLALIVPSQHPETATTQNWKRHQEPSGQISMF